jgi:hypothetical protein
VKSLVDKLFFVFVGLLLFGCNGKTTLFKKLSSSHTGITFNNQIPENDSVNIMDVENVYNGGGVGIGDFNNDGLQDIYFTGNLVSCKLYLNKGDLKFKDVTAVSGTEGEGKWARGISIVDINNDGWQDIYVSATLLKDSIKRENIFYINQGLNKDGIPVFKDLASEYGLNDRSHTTQAAFFDYDNDGDLDCYLAVNEIIKADHPATFRQVMNNGRHPNTDKLFRNDWDSSKGHPVFTNVSAQAGILMEGYAHSVTICDLNLDGWKDIYVANDYLSDNILYINNHDGTFTNRVKEYFKHTAANAMGADVVDINNDGLSDIIELDMNPEDNYRKKTMLPAGNYQNYLNNDYYGHQYQYVRNNLQLNRGIPAGVADSMRHPLFSEIGFYSGIAETDWSWTPLVYDFDADGNRDMIITNGFPKDVTDRDFVVYRNTAFALNDKKALLDKIPTVKISNYAFRNNGNLQFTNVTGDWGLNDPSFSNGAAIADLDNDGDLDVVINNIDDEAMVYANNASIRREELKANWLEVNLYGPAKNRGAFGAWVKIFYDSGKYQAYETNPVRGYLSSVSNTVYFGLGSVTNIDSLVVIWPGNVVQSILNVKVNQMLPVKYTTALPPYEWKVKDTGTTLFKDVTCETSLQYQHTEEDFNDYTVQKLLPHKLSQYGPGMAVGDIDKDGIDDLLVGGNTIQPAVVFLQHKNGQFEKRNLLKNNESLPCDDMGLLLFDADNDKDLDLYISSGGSRFATGAANYQDRLYLNDGKGNFTHSNYSLPLNHTSKSCVRAADFDKDGDLDLFIGGRAMPDRYPQPVSSLLLRNDSKPGQIRFTDVTSAIAPALLNLGLICDGLFTDYNNDGWPDLVLAGEWMPVTFIKNVKGKFTNETTSTGIEKFNGWWNTVAGGDFDNDGDIDYIAGNTGLNNYFTASGKYPLNNYLADFDNNGKFESITTKFIKDQQGILKEYPVLSRDEIVDQLPSVKKGHLSYASFANTTIDGLFEHKIFTSAFKSSVNLMASSYLKNLGNGKFEMYSLPALAQLAPVFGIQPFDFNNDGNLDILLAGNDYSTEVFNGRLDASSGLVMLGDGKGNFNPIPVSESGLILDGNAKSMVCISRSNGQPMFIASQNRGPLKCYQLNKQIPALFKVKDNVIAQVRFQESGKKQKQEFYFGSGFLSQSGRYTIRQPE